MKEKKKTPAPNTYKISRNDKVVNGKMNKTQGITFMSESEYLGKHQPGPSHYQLNESQVKKRLVGFKIIKPKSKYHWKPIKSTLPGSATYTIEG